MKQEKGGQPGKKKNFLRHIKSLIKSMVLFGYRLLTHLVPVKKRTVVFMSSLGRSYTGNPRAICEEMAREGLLKRFRCYYILDDPKRFSSLLPKGVHPLKNARLRYYIVMAAAGIWVSDTRFQNYMVKRKETIYIQTWHGTPLKKLGLDLKELHMAGGESLLEYQEEFRKNAATWDYLISQNPFSSKVFRQAFDFHKTMLEIGYPRNDILVNAAQGMEISSDFCEQKLRRKLRIPEGKKVMLYAPTWRDDRFYNERDYRFATELDFSKMRQEFGDSYVLVVKFHYMVREKNALCCPDFIRTVGEEIEISKLYLLADLLITDYSSAMFDYSILGRPMYFYAYDLKNYKDVLRGFYFDFEAEAPGPIVTTTDALIAAIKREFSQKEKERYQRFAEKYNPFDDGNASKKVVEIIKRRGERRENE